MLHAFAIVTGTGTVLFDKVWSGPGATSVVCALLTTLRVLARTVTGGLHLAHIAPASNASSSAAAAAASASASSDAAATAAEVAVTLVSDARTQLCCFLLHSASDGYAFGRLCAARLLSAFVASSQPATVSSGVATAGAHAAFGARLLDTLSGADRDALFALKRETPGVATALLVYDADGRTVGAASAVAEEIGLVANLRSLVSFGDEVLLPRGDRTIAVRLETARHRVLVRRLSLACLVVAASRSRDPAVYAPRVEACAALLEKLFEFLSAIRVS